MRMLVLRPVGLATLWIAAAGWCGTGMTAVLAAESEAPERPEPGREIQREADRRDVRRAGEGMRQRPPMRPAVELQEVTRELQKARAELQELRAAGREEAAMQKKRQVQELERQVDRLERLQREADRAPLGDRPGRPARDVGPRRPPEGPELERKLQHLQVAIENLHAAGLHEPAEHLAQQAQIMRRNLDAQPGRVRPPGARDAEVERLQAEIRDLRQVVGELRGRVEELARDSRGR